MRILVVEDSEGLASTLKRGLEKLGYAADVVGDGRRGLQYAIKEPYDVIVLDLMLPELRGFDVLSALRRAGRDTPVLILSALDTLDDKVKGLRGGADDYLVKPFAFDELVARLEALVRRRAGVSDPVISVSDLRIDTAARLVTRAGETVQLKAREYALLVFLAMRQGKTVSRIEIEDHLYGEDNFPMSNAVPAAISTLRARLAGAGSGELIHTRRGLGYVLEEARP